MPEDKASIQISRELYEKAKKYVEEQGGFNSVEELVEFLLEEVLESETAEQGKAMSKEEEEKVKERLRALGYI